MGQILLYSFADLFYALRHNRYGCLTSPSPFLLGMMGYPGKGRGINPRMCEAMFKRIEEAKSGGSTTEYSVKVSKTLVSRISYKTWLPSCLGVWFAASCWIISSVHPSTHVLILRSPS